MIQRQLEKDELIDQKVNKGEKRKSENGSFEKTSEYFQSNFF